LKEIKEEKMMHLAIRCILPGAMLFAAAAMGQNLCVQNEYNLVNRQRLNCTANDVRIAKVANVRDPLTGAAITSCQAGQTFSFLADFQIVTTSSQARENIGLYIATNSQTQALTGACEDHIISQQGPCPTGNQTCGSDNYHETDPPPDNCGDTSSNDLSANTTLGGKGVQVVTLEIDNFLCQAPAGTNQVQLPNCTSWQIPGGTIQCKYTNPDDYPLTGPGGTPAAIPGSPAKCNCDIIPLGVTVQVPNTTVTKRCTTSDSSGLNTSCSSGVEGSDEVTYTVKVHNGANFGDITVNSIADSVYGNVAGTCPSGTTCTADSTTCSVPQTVAAGGDYTCTFTAHKYGDPDTATVTDKVTAGVTSQVGTTSVDSNTVTVTPTEAPSSATVTKGLGSPNLTAGCATANFTVDVQNTSSTQFDETETLTALSDSVYGSIAPTTTDTTNVSNNTCFTSASGVSLAPGAHYNCSFKGQFCGTLGSVAQFGTGTCTNGFCSRGQPGTTACTTNSQCDLTCLGLSHINHINATINGDEGPTDIVTATTNTLTTNVCLNAFTQSQ
jgi:hypothetical protein